MNANGSATMDKRTYTLDPTEPPRLTDGAKATYDATDEVRIDFADGRHTTAYLLD